MKAELVKLADIELDDDGPSRAWIRRDRVDDYAAVYADKEQAKAMPAVVLFHDGSKYWIGDGKHRSIAAISAGLKEIWAVVRKGSRDDAFGFSLSANSTHGVPPDAKDREKSVRWLLGNPRYSEYSVARLAKLVGCSFAFADKIRKQVLAEEGREAPEFVQGADGKMYPSNARPKPPPAEADREPGDDSDEEAEVPARGPEAPPRPSGPCDCLGLPLPGPLENVFLLADKFKQAKQLYNQLTQLVNEIASAPGGEVYRKSLKFEMADGREHFRCTDLRNSYRRLDIAEPYAAVCPDCHHDHPGNYDRQCRRCHGLGWVTRSEWETAPEDRRAVVEALRPS